MALLNILQFPDPRLKKVATDVDSFDASLNQLIDDMFETLYEAQGVGLAAIQVNDPRRVIVVDVSEQQNAPLCLINPKIQETIGKIEWDEGCLSFPGVYAKVGDRFKEITVDFLDREGKPQQLSKIDGLLAVCIQHEIDHLNGITFYDHLSPVKQILLRKKLDKARRRAL